MSHLPEAFPGRTPEPARPGTLPGPDPAPAPASAGETRVGELGSPAVFSAAGGPVRWTPAADWPGGPTSELPVTATSLPRWSGKRTALVAAVVIGLSSVGAVVAAAATPNGIAAPTDSGRVPGGGQRDGGGAPPGIPGQQAVPGQQGVPGQQSVPGQQGQRSQVQPDRSGGGGAGTDPASPPAVVGTT